MNRVELLEKMTHQLRRFSEEEVKRLVTFYDEMVQDRMEDGMTEEEAVASIGKIEDAVEAAMYDVSLPTLMKTRVRESREMAPNRVLWMVLVILGFPIWFPLIMAFAVVILTIYLSIWITIASLFLVEISLAAAGTLGLFAGFMNIFVVSVPSGLFLTGMSLVCCALALLFFKPLLFLTRQLASATVSIARKVKSLFIRKEVQK